MVRHRLASAGHVSPPNSFTPRPQSGEFFVRALTVRDRIYARPHAPHRPASSTSPKPHEHAAIPAGAADMADRTSSICSDVDPSIQQDMRYAGAWQFHRPRQCQAMTRSECLLVRQAAEALKAVQADLKSQGFTLKTYDCYRPARAVMAFVAWAKLPDDARRRRLIIRRLRRARCSQTISRSSPAIPAALPWTSPSFPSTPRPCRQARHQRRRWPAPGRRGHALPTRA